MLLYQVHLARIGTQCYRNISTLLVRLICFITKKSNPTTENSLEYKLYNKNILHF